jgi:hypothetical protein
MSTSDVRLKLNSARAFLRRLNFGIIVLLALAATGILQIYANSEATIPGTDRASDNLDITAEFDGVLTEVLGEPYHFDH